MANSPAPRTRDTRRSWCRPAPPRPCIHAPPPRTWWSARSSWRRRRSCWRGRSRKRWGQWPDAEGGGPRAQGVHWLARRRALHACATGAARCMAWAWRASACQAACSRQPVAPAPHARRVPGRPPTGRRAPTGRRTPTGRRAPVPQTSKAREFARQQKKPQALMCLKKKKMLEQQMERLDALIARSAWSGSHRVGWPVRRAGATHGLRATAGRGSARRMRTAAAGAAASVRAAERPDRRAGRHFTAVGCTRPHTETRGKRPQPACSHGTVPAPPPLPPCRVVEQKGMLEEQSMMLAVVSDMASATHAQKKAMKARPAPGAGPAPKGAPGRLRPGSGIWPGQGPPTGSNRPPRP
jgi:hypothetical protein